MPDRQNRSRHVLWRRLVAARLRESGFDRAQPVAPREFREALTSGPVPDVSGLPHELFLRASSSLSPRWGVDLAEAEQAARITGRSIPVVVQYRREVDTGQAFAVLTLDALADLLTRAFYPPSIAVLERDLGSVLDAPALPHADGEDG